MAAVNSVFTATAFVIIKTSAIEAKSIYSRPTYINSEIIVSQPFGGCMVHEGNIHNVC